MGMCTNDGINVSLRILLELLRETAPFFSYRGLKLLGGYFTSHMKNLPDNEKSKTERDEQTEIPDYTGIKYVLKPVLPLDCSAVLLHQPCQVFITCNPKGCSLMQLCNHSDLTPILNQILLDRAFYLQIFSLFLNAGAQCVLLCLILTVASFSKQSTISPT